MARSTANTSADFHAHSRAVIAAAIFTIIRRRALPSWAADATIASMPASRDDCARRPRRAGPASANIEPGRYMTPRHHFTMISHKLGGCHAAPRLATP